MPVSDKKFDEVLYDLLPAVYHTADKEANPVPLPLKRFLQVASVGFEKVETDIDGLAMLFDVDKVDVKYLPLISRMLGYELPHNCSVEEARGIIRNLPYLYKIKGTTQIFEVISRIVFGIDSKITVRWQYQESYTSLNIVMDFYDKITNVDNRQEVFEELVNYFRPVNVGVKWEFLIRYVDEYTHDFEVTNTIDHLLLHDNYLGNKAVNVLNKLRLNDSRYGTFASKEFVYEKYKRQVEETFFDKQFHLDVDVYNTMKEDLSFEEINLNLQSDLDELEKKFEEKDLVHILIDDNYSKGDSLLTPMHTTSHQNTLVGSDYLPEIYGKGKTSDVDSIKFIEINTDEFTNDSKEVTLKDVVEDKHEENTEYSFNDSATDSIKDYSHLLNLGRLSSTLVLSKPIQYKEVRHV